MRAARPVMKKVDLSADSVDDLWALHEEIASILSARMGAEKLKLEKRLEQIERTSEKTPEPRPYPDVHPKFRNPNSPHRTWSGRGKQPLWFRHLLAHGTNIDELRIGAD
jgi:DNA-binding protein H-NS